MSYVLCLTGTVLLQFRSTRSGSDILGTYGTVPNGDSKEADPDKDQRDSTGTQDGTVPTNGWYGTGTVPAVPGLVLMIWWPLWMRISTTTLANLMSIMAATVSSSARSRVGPKHTPRLDTVIRFWGGGTQSMTLKGL